MSKTKLNKLGNKPKREKIAPNCIMIVGPKESKKFFEFGYDNNLDKPVRVEVMVFDLENGEQICR